MPEPRVRRKSVYTAPTGRSSAQRPSPRWFAMVMVGLLLLGLAWVVTYYLSQGQYPIPNFHTKNLIAGFGVLLVGFGMLTRWR